LTVLVGEGKLSRREILVLYPRKEEAFTAGGLTDWFTREEGLTLRRE
jgi:hypothetical protein